MSATVKDLEPGMIGFGPIRGAAGLLVSVGQAMLREGFHVGTLDIRHVFVVVDIVPTPLTDEWRWTPYVVEAMPSGARRVRADDRWSPEYAYVKLPEDYPGQALDAARVAEGMVGTPYSFGSYAALAAWRWGLSMPRLEAWINRRQSDIVVPLPSGRPGVTGLPCEAICSVLADQAWSLTGKKIMQGVPHQCVTPGALAGRLLTMPDVRWIFPGIS